MKTDQYAVYRQKLNDYNYPKRIEEHFTVKKKLKPNANQQKKNKRNI